MTLRIELCVRCCVLHAECCIILWKPLVIPVGSLLPMLLSMDLYAQRTHREEAGRRPAKVNYGLCGMESTSKVFHL